MNYISRNTTPIKYPDTRRISIIIPAAGFGSRMKSYGPKSLIKIKNDLTIIENQLRYIYKYFYKPQVILVAGLDAGKVRESLSKRDVTVVENLNWEHTNVVSSIGIGLDLAKHKHVLVIYGDLVFNAWTLKAPFGTYSMLLTDKYGLMKQEEVGCTVYKNTVLQMMYDLPNKWAQIGYFTGKELEMLKEICIENKYLNYFGFEAINMIIDKGGHFSAFSPPRMKITDIDSSRDMHKIGKIL